MKKRIAPKQIIIDRRHSSDSGKSWKVVEDVIYSHEEKLSEEDKIAHKIFVNDHWIWFKDLRTPVHSCPGEKKALEYVGKHDRLHPECKKCRKVLVFGFDEEFLKRISEEFITKHLDFDFKIARDLGVFIAYCREDSVKDKLIDFLNEFLRSHQLKGRIQWRVAGRYLQSAAPHLFESAKMLK